MTHIRLASPDDAGEIQAIYAPFCGDSPVSFEIVPPAVAEMAARIAATTAYYPWLVAESGEGIRGYVYASRYRDRAAYRWAVDTTVYIHAAARGQGVGTALYTALFSLLRAQGMYTAYANITLPNPASIALHRSHGFTPVGVYHHVGYKCGGWHDVSWWEKCLRPPTTPPAETRPIHTLQGTAAWDAAMTAGMQVLESAINRSSRSESR